MPITTDIVEHDYFGSLIRKSMAEGRFEGERRFFLKQIASRFGHVPERASDRIGTLGAEEIEELGVRFAKGESLEELFGAI